MTRFAIVLTLLSALLALACEDGPSDSDVATCKRYCELVYHCGDPISSSAAAVTNRADGDLDAESQSEQDATDTVEADQMEADTGEGDLSLDGDADSELESDAAGDADRDAQADADTEPDVEAESDRTDGDADREGESDAAPGDADAEPDAEAEPVDGDVDESAESEQGAKGDAARLAACRADCDMLKGGNWAVNQPLLGCGHSQDCDAFSACVSEAVAEETTAAQ